MSTARLSAPRSSVRARSRATTSHVRAVANPTSKTAAQPSKGATPVQKQQEKPCAPAVVEENTLHNSFYLPYHCVYQHNVIVELPGQAKTPDAFDSSWSGSSYL